MKSDVYKFEKNATEFKEITDVAARIAAYNNLAKKDELKLLLLSEELVEMLPRLLQYGSGEFWIENNGSRYEIHAALRTDEIPLASERDQLLAVSKTGTNAAAVGIVNKIRIAAEVMMSRYAEAAAMNPGIAYADAPYAAYDMGVCPDPMSYSAAWALSTYREEAKDTPEAWDELEKSLIANLADDVIVGIIGSKVDIVVIKTF